MAPSGFHCVTWQWNPPLPRLTAQTRDRRETEGEKKHKHSKKASAPAWANVPVSADRTAARPGSGSRLASYAGFVSPDG